MSDIQEAEELRHQLFTRVGRAIAGITHGDGHPKAWDVVGYPIQQACYSAAVAAIERLETFGWGPYPYDGRVRTLQGVLARTQEQMIQTLDEYRQMWGETHDSWVARARRNPKEEIRLLNLLTEHHKRMLGDCEHKLAILSGEYDWDHEFEPTEVTAQEAPRVEAGGSGGGENDQPRTERQVSDPRL